MQHQVENTLGSLWPKVEENYAGAMARISTVEAAKLNELSVKGNTLPQINMQMQNTYGTYKGGGGVFFPQPVFFNINGLSVPLGSSSMATNTFSSAIFEWELFSFGKLKKENEAVGALYNKAIDVRDVYILDFKRALS